MTMTWWLCAAGLLVLWNYVLNKGDAFVLRLTGRQSRPPEDGRDATFYALLSIGLGFWIAIPPTYLLPNADPLVLIFFVFVGSTVGGLAAQGLYGRKQDAS